MSSPVRRHRGSIATINSDFIPRTTRSRSSSPTKIDLRKSLSKAFSLNWPTGSSRHRKVHQHAKFFTVRMNQYYRETNPSNDPKDHYDKAMAYLEEIQMLRMSRPHAEKDFIESIENDMIESIFGSNAIEKVGGSIRITFRLCLGVFRGEIPNLETIDERDEEYAEELQALAASQRPTDIESVIRSRREIVQHAIAMKYLVNKLVIQEEELTEDILKEAHRILMQYSEHEEGGGVYRRGEEAASHGLRPETDDEYEKRVRDAKRLKPNRPPPERKSMPVFVSKFVRGASVPIYMKKLVEEYRKDITEAEEKGDIDPMHLAAKYCTFFVCIHPFEDGNGRICRLLLNSILLKFGGACISIGVDPAEREAYLEQAYHANKDFTKEDYGDVEWGQRKSHFALAGMVVEKMRAKLEKARNCLLQK